MVCILSNETLARCLSGRGKSIDWVLMGKFYRACLFRLWKLLK